MVLHGIIVPDYPNTGTFAQIAAVNRSTPRAKVEETLMRLVESGKVRHKREKIIDWEWSEFGQSREHYFIS